MAAGKLFLASILLCINNSNLKSVDYEYMLRAQNHVQDWISEDTKVSNDEHHLENSVPDNFIYILIPYSDNKPNRLRKGTNKKKIFFPKNPRVVFKKKTPKTTSYKLLFKTTKRKTSRITRTTFRPRQSTTYKPPRSSTYKQPTSSTYKPSTTSTYQTTTTTGNSLQTTTRESTEPRNSNNDISVEIVNGDNHFHFVIPIPGDKEVKTPSESNDEDITSTIISKEEIVLEESENGETTPPEDDNGETNPGESKNVEIRQEKKRERQLKNVNGKINQ